MYSSLIKKLIFFVVFLWQKTRSVRNALSLPQCRFYPTCSDYFLKAIEVNGLIIGSYMTLKRLFSCHPFCEGGVDNVTRSL